MRECLPWVVILERMPFRISVSRLPNLNILNEHGLIIGRVQLVGTTSKCRLGIPMPDSGNVPMVVRMPFEFQARHWGFDAIRFKERREPNTGFQVLL